MKNQNSGKSFVAPVFKMKTGGRGKAEIFFPSDPEFYILQLPIYRAKAELLCDLAPANLEFFKTMLRGCLFDRPLETIKEEFELVKELSIWLAQLYLDFLKHCRKVQSLALEGKCQGKEGFADWQCCKDHKRLKQKGEELRIGAEILSKSEPEGKGGPAIFSPRWWRENGGFDVPHSIWVVN